MKNAYFYIFCFIILSRFPSYSYNFVQTKLQVYKISWLDKTSDLPNVLGPKFAWILEKMPIFTYFDSYHEVDSLLMPETLYKSGDRYAESFNQSKQVIW